MKPTEAEARPPYVVFEMRQKENRAKSQEQGYVVYDEEPWVIVTPQGSKDRTERVASEWFEQKQADVVGGRFPEAWLRAYRNEFELWKKGEAIPLNGLSLKNWPVATKAQVSTLIGLHILTVEDLASANEETITRLGMGGRALKQRAQEYLESASTSGVAAHRMTALETENESLKETVKRQGEQLAQLMARLSQPAPVQLYEAPAEAQSPSRGGIALNDIMDDAPTPGLRL